MNSILKNWKTSSAGLGAIFAGLGVLFNALAHNPIDLNQVVAGAGAVSTGIGLLLAHDGQLAAPESDSTSVDDTTGASK